MREHRWVAASQAKCKAKISIQIQLLNLIQCFVTVKIFAAHCFSRVTSVLTCAS